MYLPYAKYVPAVYRPSSSKTALRAECMPTALRAECQRRRYAPSVTNCATTRKWQSNRLASLIPKIPHHRRCAAAVSCPASYYPPPLARRLALRPTAGGKEPFFSAAAHQAITRSFRSDHRQPRCGRRRSLRPSLVLLCCAAALPCGTLPPAQGRNASRRASGGVQAATQATAAAQRRLQM